MKNKLLTLILIVFYIAGCESSANKINPELILDSKAENLFNQAQQFEEIGLKDSALFCYYDANEIEPGNPLILYKRGLILLEYRSLGAALIDLDQSILLTQDDELKQLRNQKRTSTLLKMGLSKNLVSTISYFSINDTLHQGSLYERKFSDNAFAKEGGLEKGVNIVITYKPGKGEYSEFLRNSKIFLTPSDSNFRITKLDEETFNLFIPKNHKEQVIRFDISITPNPGFNIVTYYSNRITSYPDTMGLHQSCLPISID